SQCQDDSAGLLPGAELVYQIKVPVPADQLPPGGRVVNVARAEGVSLPGETQPDLPGHDITAATVSVTSFLWNDVKLNVTKDDGLQEAYPGTAHQYAISVVNEGKSDAFGVQVRDIVPQMLQDVSWTCSAQS